MRQGGKILSTILKKISESIRPGMKTREIDQLARELVSYFKAKPAFLNYNGFPATICVSVNEEIVHGLPSDRVLKAGDVLKLDMGVNYQGFYTDSAITVVVGFGSDARRQKLIDVTRNALEIGIEQAKTGNTLGDIGHAIQEYVESNGFSVIRDLVGHGIGRELHEEPEVLNYGKAGSGIKLKPGMVIAIEPMVVEGSWQIVQGSDGFSYVTADNKLAAHFEHTVAITKDGPQILTS